MYLQRSNVYDKNVEAVQRLLNAALATDNYRGKWKRLAVDGYYGAETENAVRAFQHNYNPRIDQTGIVGDTTYRALLGTGPVMSASAPKVFLTAAAPSVVKASAQAVPKKNPFATVYDVGSTAVKTANTVKTVVDPSEQQFAYILSYWETILTQQYEGLLRRLDKFPAKQKMRTRNIMRQMERCKKFLVKASRYGIVKATSEFGSQLTKEEALSTIQEMAELIKESSLTKGVTAISKSLSKIKCLLKPVLDIFDKIPGLKYYSVVEKLCKGTKLLIQGDYENSFAVFMDALRELLEQIVIDALIGLLVAAGGWVALVGAIIVIIIGFLLDYFCFSDNPGESLADKYLGMKTHHFMMENAPVTYQIITGNTP